MGRRLGRLTKKYYITVKEMDAALRFDYRMPSSEEMADFRAKHAAMDAGKKALKMSAHLTKQGKTVDEVSEEIAKELSPDALLDSTEVMCAFACPCIKNIFEVDIDEFEGNEELKIVAKGKNSSWDASEFDFVGDDGGEVWKLWTDLTADERFIVVVERQLMFIDFMTHITSGFGSVTVGKSRLRRRTAAARTTS